jgi:hypothetical protein
MNRTPSLISMSTRLQQIAEMEWVRDKRSEPVIRGPDAVVRHVRICMGPTASASACGTDRAACTKALGGYEWRASYTSS